MTSNYEYVHTKFSRAYIQVPGPGNFFQFMNDECLSTMVHLHKYVKDRAAEDDKPVFDKSAKQPELLTVSPTSLVEGTVHKRSLFARWHRHVILSKGMEAKGYVVFLLF